ncbi:hemerythrin domain-containing protein [Actinopolymorpha sp. B11F2]|uniref:hemerythrin domain-containing protein n=1 Tax=Actinopolymorpha sp. B11F2 TaxID=3160862 RepID=UPI0032E4D318
MCEYCGCRQIEPIAELMDEHLGLLELSGDIRRSLIMTDYDAAVETLREFSRMLEIHVRREERGVFTALKDQGEFAEAVRELEQEHASFDQSLAALDPSAADFDAVVNHLLNELSDHIDKENLGIFPVAVVSLGASGWDTVTRAHERDN